MEIDGGKLETQGVPFQSLLERGLQFPTRPSAEPKVVDAILRSLSRGASCDPFAERAPTPVMGGTATIQ